MNTTNYSLRKKIEKLLKSRRTIEEIGRRERIDIKLLELWEYEFNLKKEIEELILAGEEVVARKKMEGFITEYGREYNKVYFEGKIAGQNGDTKREEECLRKRIELVPDDATAMSSLIKILNSRGEHREARQLFIRKIELEPDRAKNIFYYAWHLFKEENNPESALKMVERALQLVQFKRETKEALYLKKEILKSLGRESESNAVGEQRIALKINDTLGNPISCNMQSREVIILGESSLINTKNMTNPDKVADKDKQTRCNLKQARDIITGSEEINPEQLKEISEIMQDEEETLRALIEAETSVRIGFKRRAITKIETHKKKCAKLENQEEIKLLRKALLVIGALKKITIYDPLKWEELYEEYWKIKNREEVSTDDDGETGR